MRTPDKITARKILDFCKVPRTANEVLDYLGLASKTATYERLKRLRLWELLEKVGVRKYKATKVGTNEARMPEHYVLDSAWVLAAVRDKPGSTWRDIAQLKGYKRVRTVTRLRRFIVDGYISSYQCHTQSMTTYSLTPKGERLLAEIEGSKFKPTPRVNSVFSLGSFV